MKLSLERTAALLESQQPLVIKMTWKGHFTSLVTLSSDVCVYLSFNIFKSQTSFDGLLLREEFVPFTFRKYTVLEVFRCKGQWSTKRLLQTPPAISMGHARRAAGAEVPSSAGLQREAGAHQLRQPLPYSDLACSHRADAPNRSVREIL